MSGVLHGVRGVEVAQWWFVPAAGAVLADWCADVVKLHPPASRAAQPVMQRAAFGASAGGMTVAGGIAAALFHRERTGEPAVVDVSLLGTAMWIMAPDIIATKLLGIDLPVGDRTQPPNPIVNSYRTQDGRWLFLNMLQPDRYWPDLCRRLGRTDLLTDPRFADGRSRFAHRAECVRELDAIFATRTLAEWRAALADAEGVWAPMQTARELADDPQAVANGSLPEMERGHGTRFTLVASPVQFDETAPALRPAPDLGQHTEEVLLALGLSWEEIAAAKEAGAVS